MGVHRYDIRDGGPGFVGNSWCAFAQTFNVVLVSSPVRETNQMGVIGRHVSLLKIGIRLIETGPCLEIS